MLGGGGKNKPAGLWYPYLIFFALYARDTYSVKLTAPAPSEESCPVKVTFSFPKKYHYWCKTEIKKIRRFKCPGRSSGGRRLR